MREARDERMKNFGPMKKEEEKKMATEKECVERAMRELFTDANYVKRIVDRAERMNFRGFEEQVKDGKKLFVMDLKGA